MTGVTDNPIMRSFNVQLISRCLYSTTVPPFRLAGVAADLGPWG